MPTKFKTRHGMELVERVVKEDIAEVAAAVDACLNGNLTFATFTDADTGQELSVNASSISDIREA